MSDPRSETERLRRYAEQLANDPEFVAECLEIQRKIDAGEDLGPSITAEELRAMAAEIGRSGGPDD